MARLKPYDLWLAHYNEIPGYPCELHQISDNGKVNGISGKVDTDVAYQDYGATSRITLDTQEYVFKKVNQTYRFLAKSEEPPVVTSSNPKAFPVKFIHKEKRGYLYELKACLLYTSSFTSQPAWHFIMIFPSFPVETEREALWSS